jgi:hypothetical protein
MKMSPWSRRVPHRYQGVRYQRVGAEQFKDDWAPAFALRDAGTSRRAVTMRLDLSEPLSRKSLAFSSQAL